MEMQAELVASTDAQMSDRADTFAAMRSAALAMFQQRTKDFTKVTELSERLRQVEQYHTTVERTITALSEKKAVLEATVEAQEAKATQRSELLANFQTAIKHLCDRHQQLQGVLQSTRTLYRGLQQFTAQYGPEGVVAQPLLAAARRATNGCSSEDLGDFSREMRHRINRVAVHVQHMRRHGSIPTSFHDDLRGWSVLRVSYAAEDEPLAPAAAAMSAVLAGNAGPASDIAAVRMWCHFGASVRPAFQHQSDSAFCAAAATVPCPPVTLEDLASWCDDAEGASVAGLAALASHAFPEPLCTAWLSVSHAAPHGTGLVALHSFVGKCVRLVAGVCAATAGSEWSMAVELSDDSTLARGAGADDVGAPNERFLSPAELQRLKAYATELHAHGTRAGVPVSMADDTRIVQLLSRWSATAATEEVHQKAAADHTAGARELQNRSNEADELQKEQAALVTVVEALERRQKCGAAAIAALVDELDDEAAQWVASAAEVRRVTSACHALVESDALEAVALDELAAATGVVEAWTATEVERLATDRQTASVTRDALATEHQALAARHAQRAVALREVQELVDVDLEPKVAALYLTLRDVTEHRDALVQEWRSGYSGESWAAQHLPPDAAAAVAGLLRAAPLPPPLTSEDLSRSSPVSEAAESAAVELLAEAFAAGIADRAVTLEECNGCPSHGADEVPCADMSGTGDGGLLQHHMLDVLGEDFGACVAQQLRALHEDYLARRNDVTRRLAAVEKELSQLVEFNRSYQ